MASYGIQVQMYIDDKPIGRVFNHSITSSTVSALYSNVDKTDGPEEISNTLSMAPISKILVMLSLAIKAVR